MRIETKRTDSENTDFIILVKSLDAYLKITDGDEHHFYNQYNNIDIIKHVIVVYKDKEPIGCGAIKHFDKTYILVLTTLYLASDYIYIYIHMYIFRAEIHDIYICVIAHNIS